jgi:trimethylamine--corrinoid protein Co-methyltransferase
VALRGHLTGMSPQEKLLKNIQDTRDGMLARYVPPEIDPGVLNAMNTFMEKKGVDPDDLPLYH